MADANRSPLADSPSADGLTLALAQTPGELDGVAARLAWLEQAAAPLAARGVDLLLLPELFASGYNVPDRLAAAAEPADGPTARRIAALAARCGLAIHYGYPEAAGGRLYNAAQCFGPDGVRLGGHRKLLLPPGFEGESFAAGSACTPFRHRGLTIATLICYDVEFPETVRHAAAAGADLVLVPTALAAEWAVVARRMVPTRALENGVYLAYANHCGTEGDLRYLGESCIAAPDGRDLARAGAGPEILTARLTRSAVEAARRRLPYRADLTRLRFG